MKKAMTIVLAAALVGGLFTVASARPGRGGDCYRGGERGSCFENGGGRGPCWQEEGGERPLCRGGEEGDFRRGRGYGKGLPGRDIEGVEGEVDEASEASAIVSAFIERTGNPNLKVGGVTEAGRDFEVEIVTKEGSLANKMYVEKSTGRLIPAYRFSR